MNQYQVRGRVHLFDRTYAFEVEEGYGLVKLANGQHAIIKFTCTLESRPPQGDGQIITTTDSRIELFDGKLLYNEKEIHIGLLEKEEEK